MQIQSRNDLDKLLEFYNLPRVILELGVAEGWFTKEILKWQFDKLYLVDNWGNIPNQSGDGNFPDSWHKNNYTQILERVKPFTDKVVILKGLTVDMVQHIPDNSLGLAFIDACHEKVAAKKDLELYYPKVIDGGIIVCHDYLNTNYGVNEAVKEFCEDRFTINLIPDGDEQESFYNGSSWFRKGVYNG